METAIIVADMVTLKESVIKSKMTHREVEDVAGLSSLTFIKEEDNMVVQEMTEAVICLPCNMCWIIRQNLVVTIVGILILTARII